MAVTTRKYNPGFLTDDELVASFCVRTVEFEMMVEVIRECTEASNPHQIVIGPRGSGKTSLLLRIAAEVRRDPELAVGLCPVVFAEESYEVSTAGEFWLECLAQLAAQAPHREDEPDLHRTLNELRTIRDDRELADRCLGALLDFSDREGKRLVLMVENLDMMFRDMAGADAGWRLRKVLQTEPRIALIASATSRFDEIDNPKHALYDLFSVRTLRPLDTSECAALWEAVAGQCPPPGTIRSLQILTGGSPRLLTIVARFGAELSFRKLMASLLDVIDDHTEYFKSHLESLPAQERRVYLALAALWKPATTREIADHARLDTSKCSAQLTRLVDRGAVQTAGGSARRKQYYLTERLYNIYYLLRRSRMSDRLVEALIRFMESYYTQPELKEIGTRIIREAQSFTTEMQALSQAALARLISLPSLAEYREELLAIVPEGFAEFVGPKETTTDEEELVSVEYTPDGSWMDRRKGSEDEDEERAAKRLFRSAVALSNQGQAEAAIVVFDRVVHRFGESNNPAILPLVGMSLTGKGTKLASLDRIEEALVACEEVLLRFGESKSTSTLEPVAMALAIKGSLLALDNRPEEAINVYNELVLRYRNVKPPFVVHLVATALTSKGSLLNGMNRLEDALIAYDEVVSWAGTSDTLNLLELVAKALVNKATVLGGLNRPEDALMVFDAVVSRFGESAAPTLLETVAVALFNKGQVLAHLKRVDDAVTAFGEIVDRFGKCNSSTMREAVAKALVKKGAILGEQNRPEDAKEVFEKVVRQFGQIDAPSILEQVALALFNKAVAFIQLEREEDALSTFGDVADRFGIAEHSKLQVIAGYALVSKGALELSLEQFEAALDTAHRTINLPFVKLPEIQVKSYLIRARATWSLGNWSECEGDVEAVLALLPEIGTFPKEDIGTLMFFSVAFGPERMCELIKGSLSADILLPLTTALELELGLEPRVAQEVKEVAEDIRRDLAQFREVGTAGSIDEKVVSSTAEGSERKDA